MSVQTFETAVRGFCESFLAAMAERIADVCTNCRQPSDSTVDVHALVHQQCQEEQNFKSPLPLIVTDWDEVRHHLHKLKSMMVLN